MDITFKLTDKQALLIRGNISKEIPRDAIVEILHTALTHICPNRDYGNITSVSKLFKTIDLECAPDDSDNEAAEAPKEVPKEEQKTVKKEPVKSAAKEEPKTKEPVKEAAKPVAKEEPEAKKPLSKPAPPIKATPVKPAAKEESSNSDSE